MIIYINYSAIKEEGNPAICDSMMELGVLC